MTRALLFLGLLLPTLAHADLPPPGPVATYDLVVELPADSSTALVAFPVNRSRGAPNAAYERLTSGTAFDPGRSEVRFYAFAAADVAADGSALTGAPMGFGASGPPGDAALFTWFTGATVPSADLPARPSVPAIVTAIHDTFAIELTDGTLSVRRIRTRYEAAGHDAIEVDALADGSAAPPPESWISPPPPPPAPPAAPVVPAASTGCACSARRADVEPSWLAPIGALAIGRLARLARRSARS